MDTFAERLKAAREYAGIEQAQLTEKVHLSVITLSRYENGHRKPKIDNLHELATALNTTVAYLMGETEDLRPPSAGSTERMTANLNKERDFVVEQRAKTYPRPPTLEDFARVREASRSLDFFDNSDLNAAEEMLLASLNAVRSEKNIRTAQQDGVAKSA